MKIFVTRKIPEPGLEILRKEHDVEVFSYDRVPTKNEIINGLKGKDGLLCLLSDQIDAEVINSEPKLPRMSTCRGYSSLLGIEGNFAGELLAFSLLLFDFAGELEP